MRRPRRPAISIAIAPSVATAAATAMMVPSASTSASAYRAPVAAAVDRRWAAPAMFRAYRGTGTNPSTCHVPSRTVPPPAPRDPVATTSHTTVSPPPGPGGAKGTRLLAVTAVCTA